MPIQIEEILGSKNKIKLIKLFLEHEIVPLSYIRKRININYRDLKSYLSNLIRAEIIKEYDADGIKIYELNQENPKVKLLRELFKEW